MINLHLEGLRTGKNPNEKRELFALMREQEHYDRYNRPVKYPTYVQHNSSAPPTSPYAKKRAKVSRFDRSSTLRAAGCYVPNH